MTLLFIFVFMTLLLAGMQLTCLGGIEDDSFSSTFCRMGIEYLVDYGNYGMVIGICSDSWNVGSSQIWMGTLGTICQTPQIVLYFKS